MKKHKRQTATTIDGIRPDHIARYEFAGSQAANAGHVEILDVGCGTGYGSWLMASKYGLKVTAIDQDVEALKFGELHYRHSLVVRKPLNLEELGLTRLLADAVVMFEVIEHVEDPVTMLSHFNAKELYGSVPNEDVVPFDEKVHKWHYRHFTADQIEQTLRSAEWNVEEIGSQVGKRGTDANITIGNTSGRTIVFKASR